VNRLLTHRWAHFLILFAVLIYAVFFVSPDNETRQRLQFIIFDQYTKAVPRPDSDSVRILDIDDESLAVVGQWPWSRDQMAEIVTNLTALGAKVIAFDGVLAEPDRTSPVRLIERLDDEDRVLFGDRALADYDQVLAEAIRASGIFVAAFSHGSNREPPRLAQPMLALAEVKNHFLGAVQRFSGTARFLPELEQHAAGNGSFMAVPEVDGVLRRTSMIFSDGRELYPSLSAEALRVSFKPTNVYIRLGWNPEFNESSVQSRFRMAIDQYQIPLDSEGKLWVYFRPFRAKDYISAHHLLTPDKYPALENNIRDKYIFIGSSAEGLKDLRATAHNAFLPGVEIHANVLEQILQNNYLLRPDFIEVTEAGLIFAVGLAIIIFAPFISALILFALSLTMIAMMFGVSWVYFVEQGVLIDPFYPSLAIFIIFVVSVLLSYMRTEAEKKQVREAFGLYISPDFMAELTKDPGKLKLGGETRELTVMFTDIRSFTSISESLAPEELTQLMNDFLTPMSDLVMDNRGTIDKYMGDAMMAFWNAPLDVKDHARYACRAALKMNETLVPLNAALEEKARAQGCDPVELRAGIGINTGPASVGNMGSRQRFAYSALGDTVNLASRLEGQTKGYGGNILIGESTWRQADDFAALELDLIRVKGKQEPVRVYALLGDEQRAGEESFQQWQSLHDNMLRCYRAAEFDEALALAEQCRRGPGAELADFYAMLALRISEMKAAPPESGWDGVYVALSK